MVDLRNRNSNNVRPLYFGQACTTSIPLFDFRMLLDSVTLVSEQIDEELMCAAGGWSIDQVYAISNQERRPKI